MPGDLPRHLDRLSHAETLTVAQIVNQRTRLLRFIPQFVQSQQVRAAQIADVDVVANARPIGRGIVGAKNLNVLSAAERYLEDARDEMRLRLVRLSFVGP